MIRTFDEYIKRDFCMKKLGSLSLPQRSSMIMALIVAIAVYFGSKILPYVGYSSAIVFMLLIILGSLFDKLAWWPKGNEPENGYFFAAFWGIGIGVILPFVLSEYVFPG